MYLGRNKMKKLIVASILVCLVITLVYSAALAQSENFYIKPYKGENQTIYSDQPIILFARWGACHYGLIQDFLTATNMSWTLYKGSEVIQSDTDTDQYWGPIEQITPGNAKCMGMTPETIPITYWNFPIGRLDAGEYTLHFTWWLDHPVTDLGDFDDDGRPDFYNGSLFVNVITSITVIDR